MPTAWIIQPFTLTAFHHNALILQCNPLNNLSLFLDLFFFFFSLPPDHICRHDNKMRESASRKMTRWEEKILFTLSWAKIESNHRSSYPAGLLPSRRFNNWRTILQNSGGRVWSEVDEGGKWKVSNQINKCDWSKQPRLYRRLVFLFFCFVLSRM